MKTFCASSATINHDWYVVDATDQVLGRLATKVAHMLRGKHKPEYTPFLDTGDFIIVTHAEKIRVTGKKKDDKQYIHHTGYPGGLKSKPFKKLMAEYPERIIKAAVKGMLPSGPLGRDMLRKLKIYAGSEHPHAAQLPKELKISEEN